MYSIIKNELTLYFKQEHNSPENLNFIGFVINNGFDLDNKPDIMFTKSNFHDTLPDSQYQYVSIKKYVIDKLITEANKQANSFLNKNQGNTNFYYECKNNKNVFFGTNLGKMTALEPHETIEHSIKIVHDRYNEIFQGIISLNINHCRCEYSFIKDEFIITKYFENKPITALEALFNKNELYLQLARKQHTLFGCASPTFDEIVKLNEFLAGKKSCTIHLKNDTKLLLKISTGYNRCLCASDLLTFDSHKKTFYIDKRNQFVTDYIAFDITVNEINYLQHSTRQHIIDVYNLEDII